MNFNTPVKIAIITAIVSAHCGFTQSPFSDRNMDQALQALSVDSIFQHLSVLGDDSLQGRATGSSGGEKAARYIALQMGKIDLKTAGKSASFFQDIPLHGSIPTRESQLQIVSNRDVTTLNLWQDYILYNTGAQTFISTPLPLIFVGYGIVAPEFDYNDYQNLEIKNRIVVFLSGEPVSNDTSYFDGPLPTIYSDPVMKHRIALSRGARGSIMIPLPREKTYTDWSYWVRQYFFEDVKLMYGISENINVLINFFKAPILFQNTKYRFEEILHFDSTGTMRSFPLHLSAVFRGKFRERDFVSQNVIGMLEGSDPLLRDEYVIVSAHYDHLGVGMAVAGDSIYNGVVDNAIGTATVLELARVFKSMTIPPKRSLLFLLLTGEEKGLLGSKFYCDHPIVPLHKTIAAINIDGLAILDKFKSITGIGSEHSTLDNTLRTIAQRLGLTVAPKPEIVTLRDPVLSSDQFRFCQYGIPSILIMEGLNYQNLSTEEGLTRFLEWGQKIYHSPFDDLNQPINKAAVEQHAQVLLTFIHSVANTFIVPQWLPDSRFINTRLQTIAEKK